MSLLERARLFFDALNAQDLDTVAGMIAPTAEISTPIGSFTGGEAYREWMACTSARCLTSSTRSAA